MLTYFPIVDVRFIGELTFLQYTCTKEDIFFKIVFLQNAAIKHNQNIWSQKLFSKYDLQKVINDSYVLINKETTMNREGDDDGQTG